MPPPPPPPPCAGRGPAAAAAVCRRAAGAGGRQGAAAAERACPQPAPVGDSSGAAPGSAVGGATWGCRRWLRPRRLCGWRRHAAAIPGAANTGRSRGRLVGAAQRPAAGPAAAAGILGLAAASGASTPTRHGGARWSWAGTDDVEAAAAPAAAAAAAAAAVLHAAARLCRRPRPADVQRPFLADGPAAGTAAPAAGPAAAAAIRHEHAAPERVLGSSHAASRLAATGSASTVWK